MEVDEYWLRRESFWDKFPFSPRFSVQSSSTFHWVFPSLISATGLEFGILWFIVLFCYSISKARRDGPFSFGILWFIVLHTNAAICEVTVWSAISEDYYCNRMILVLSWSWTRMLSGLSWCCCSYALKLLVVEMWEWLVGFVFVTNW